MFFFQKQTNIHPRKDDLALRKHGTVVELCGEPLVTREKPPRVANHHTPPTGGHALLPRVSPHNSTAAHATTSPRVCLPSPSRPPHLGGFRPPSKWPFRRRASADCGVVERNKLASRAHRNNNILPREYSPLPTSPPRISSARLPSFPLPASPLFHHPFRPPAASPRRSPAQSVAVVRSTSHPHTHRKSPFFPATGRRR